MTKESLIELQKIDCNCNNCFYMTRDFPTYTKWAQWHEDNARTEYNKKREKALNDAMKLVDNQHHNAELNKIRKMKFQFDKSALLQYGSCSKLLKNVSFMPGTCQIETQDCFQHRRDTGRNE